MTIASLVVDVIANTARIEKDVARVNNSIDSIASTASRLGSLIGASFSVGALISFGQALMDDADELTRLADKTGVAIEGLQRLQVAGDDAGNSLDQITSAIVKLEDKLASGDKSAVSALRTLDLTLDQMLSKTPEQQFVAISDAIRKIEDPATRVKVAIDLFGKSGAEVLPTLVRGFDDLRDASVGMSADTAQALDTFGDKLSALWRTTKGISADFLVFMGRAAMDGLQPGKIAIHEYERAVVAATNAQQKLIDQLKSPTLAQSVVKGPGFDLAAAVRDTDSAVGSLSEQLHNAERAQVAAAQAARKHRDELDQLARSADLARAVEATVGRGLYDNRPSFTLGPLQAAPALDQLSAGLSRLKIPALTGGANPILAGLNGPGMTAVLSRVPQTITSALTGGGGMTGAASAVASQFASHFGEKIGKGIAALGSVGGPLGSAIGALAGPLIGKVFGMFNNPEKQVNPIRQAYIDAAGGLGVLNQRAHEAGITLDHLLDAKTPEKYKAAIDELNAAMQFQDQAMQTLEQTAQKYGFTLEQLGPAFSRQQLDKKAGELYQDFMVLKAGGLDVDTILGKMGSSINDFVASALRTGTEVPAAMAPMLQRMVELGQLTDANGNVITDLDAAGVHFSMTMSEGFEKVVASVTKLTDAIARGLGLAIENIPQPEVVGHVSWNVDGLPGGVDIPAMAAGGIVDRPTLALIGEAGPEAVVPLSGSRGRALAGGDSSGAREQFAVMRDHMERQAALLARLPKDIARAVRDKRQLSLVRSRRAW